uniref:Uncharacterized protein n=1 Tax=viral metagenome TaxID=1070528 RepID=A0A6C0J6Z6_9ZZZZ
MNNSTPSLLCPPLMNDGRHGTNYSPNADINLELQKKNNINNSNDYRAFLVNNASALMQQNLASFEAAASCKEYSPTVDPNGSDSKWVAYDKEINYGPAM